MDQENCGKGIRLLVVEDDDDLRHLYEDILSGHGFDVTIAASGNKGLAIAQKENFDAIITDVRMNDGDGVALMEGLRASGIDRPSVICVTAFSDLSTAEAFVKGADALFVKPIEYPTLIAAVLHFVHERRKRLQLQEKIKANGKLFPPGEDRFSSLGRLASDVAREIDQPLAVIWGSTALLMDSLSQNPSPEKMNEFGVNISRKIDQNVAQISKLIQGLKNLSRAPGEMAPVPMPWRELVEENYYLCRTSLSKAGIKVEGFEAFPKEEIMCAVGSLSQVLVTLFAWTSDVFANSKDKKILLTLEKQATWKLHFDLTVSGAQLPDTVFLKIKESLEALQGTLSVSAPQAPGAWTRVTLSLPMMSPAKKAA